MGQLRYAIEKNFLSDPVRVGDIDVYQLGKNFCDRGMTVGPHRHGNIYELTIATGGSGTVRAGDKETFVTRGDCFLSLPHDLHDVVSSDDDPLEYVFFAFAPLELTDKARYERLALSPAFPESRVVRSERLTYLTGLALDEFSRGDELSREIVTSVLTALTLVILREYSGAGAGGRKENISAADTLCYNVSSYVDTHARSMKNLSEVSDALGYSYGYISAMFRRVTGEKLCDYFLRARMQAAKELLDEGKLNVGRIAEKLNYSSAYVFSKAFKAHFGLSPMKYRAASENS